MYKNMVTSPLCKNESFWAFLPDDGPKIGKDHERSCRSDSINNHALNTSDGSQLRIGEENAWSECYKNKISKISSQFLMEDRGIFKAADTFPRKH
jgi:hypothetical protein